MFNNIGSKIKGLAKAGFFVEALAAIIGGIAIMMEEDEVIGLIIIIAGPLIAWASSWLTYGFGEAIDKICEIANNTKGLHTSTQFDNNQKHQNTIQNNPKIYTSSSSNSITLNQNGIMDIPKRNKQGEN